MAIFGPRLTARLEAWSNADLEVLSEALGAMFDPLLSIAEESGSDGEAGYIPAYGRLFEVKTANLAELRYLSNYIGTEIPAGATEAEARAIVEAEAGTQRGTRESIDNVIERIIGVGAPYQVLERTNLAGEAKAYRFVVIVPTGKATAALHEAIEAVKPGGLQFDVTELTGVWLEGTKTFGAITAAKKWSEMLEGQY